MKLKERPALIAAAAMVVGQLAAAGDATITAGPAATLILTERAWLIRAGCLGSWTWHEEQAPTNLAERLFSCAAEVAQSLAVE